MIALNTSSEINLVSLVLVGISFLWIDKVVHCLKRNDKPPYQEITMVTMQVRVLPPIIETLTLIKDRCI